MAAFLSSLWGRVVFLLTYIFPLVGTEDREVFLLADGKTEWSSYWLQWKLRDHPIGCSENWEIILLANGRRWALLRVQSLIKLAQFLQVRNPPSTLQKSMPKETRSWAAL